MKAVLHKQSSGCYTILSLVKEHSAASLHNIVRRGWTTPTTVSNWMGNLQKRRLAAIQSMTSF